MAKVKTKAKAVKDGTTVGYVLASGPEAGEVVACVVLEQRVNDDTEEVRAMLAKADEPEIPWQSWALKSEQKLPGTWHEL